MPQAGQRTSAWRDPLIMKRAATCKTSNWAGAAPQTSLQSSDAKRLYDLRMCYREPGSCRPPHHAQAAPQAEAVAAHLFHSCSFALNTASVSFTLAGISTLFATLTWPSVHMHAELSPTVSALSCRMCEAICRTFCQGGWNQRLEQNWWVLESHSLAIP